MPRAWPGCEIEFRHRNARTAATHYEIRIVNPRGVSRGVASTELDGVEIAKGVAAIPLADDGQIHRVLVVLG